MSTFTIIYLAGIIPAYYYHKWVFTKYMKMDGGEYEHGWRAVFFLAVFAFASWVTIMATTLNALITGVFPIKINSKPPKFL